MTSPSNSFRHNRRPWAPRPLRSHAPVLYGHVRLGDRRYADRAEMWAAVAELDETHWDEVDDLMQTNRGVGW